MVRANSISYVEVSWMIGLGINSNESSDVDILELFGTAQPNNTETNNHSTPNAEAQAVNSDPDHEANV